MVRHVLALVLVVVFGTVGVTATAIALPAVDGPHAGVTADGALGSADVVRVALPAGPHAASPGPLAVAPDAVPIPPPTAAATDPGNPPSPARAEVRSTRQDRAPPDAAR